MPNIELSQPTVQYTPGTDHAVVQFAWRVAGSSEWIRQNFSPAQAQLSEHAPADILAIAPGYWSDAEVRANVVDWIAEKYGFTEITFLGVAS